MSKTGRLTFAALALLPGLLGGCAGGAPTYSAFGAYFPGWLLCATIGVLAAVIARIGFVAARLATVIPAQFFVCVGIGVIVASLSWLFWIG